jgi:hypothetical protein
LRATSEQLADQDAVANMRALDAVFRAGKSARWEEV